MKFAIQVLIFVAGAGVYYYFGFAAWCCFIVGMVLGLFRSAVEK